MQIIELLADCNNIYASTEICIYRHIAAYRIWEGAMRDVPEEFKDCKVDTFTVRKTGVDIYL